MSKLPTNSLTLLLLFTLLLLSPLASAQAQTYALMVYTGTGYSSNFCFSDEPTSANIHQGCADQISSVTLRAGWSVRLYRDQDRTGPSFCLNRSDDNLSDNTFEDGSPANDAISSFQLFNQAWCGGTPTPAYPMEVYTEVGYSGNQCYSSFAETANIHSSCANQISSLLLRSGWTVRVYRDANQAGPSRCLTSNDDNLSDNTFEDGSPLNNAIASFRLVNAANCGQTAPPPNQAPNLPILVTPAPVMVTSNRTITFQVQDGGDPDNGPRNSRDFQFALERIGASWEQTSSWRENQWTVTLPSIGLYRWRARAGDGALASEWTSWRNMIISFALPVAAPVPPDPQSGMWNVPSFWQGDPTWGNNRIGNCNNNIKNVGCALTSLTMIFQYYGANHNPGTLNSCMGGAACLLYWDDPKVHECSAGKVRFITRKSFSYDLLDQELAKGPVILHIGHGDNNHFLVVLGGRGGDPRNYVVNDPGIQMGARTTLSNSLAIFKNFQPLYLLLYTGTPAVAGALLQDAIVPALVSPTPAAGETITGTVAIYRNTETSVTLRLAATSNAGAVTEMQVWTDQQANEIWQPFAEFVEVPMDSTFAVRYRDAAGNLSSTITTDVPVAPASIQGVTHSIYLPFVRR
ncbi:MAG: hypothetical protein EI684_16465 [Candidatus Viridilinea halotolerans]|uniref:Uncharacterized protein n=1 Tax=Candidatus Viridilinea halotolerans TaxID=2491704 RepID=A0A426TUS2_9CHLR|nr:MAG: hypothetical protein EI684_16465 [Candidatus Viridilinea halotolerans]